MRSLRAAVALLPCLLLLLLLLLPASILGLLGDGACELHRGLRAAELAVLRLGAAIARWGASR